MSNNTICSNALDYQYLLSETTVQDTASCEVLCAAMIECKLFSFNTLTLTCQLLTSCGVPMQSKIEDQFVKFKPGDVLAGCTDSSAQNFDKRMIYDDGSCS